MNFADRCFVIPAADAIAATGLSSDAGLESLTVDEARLLRLGALLKREEVEIFVELEQGLGIEVAATTA